MIFTSPDFKQERMVCVTVLTTSASPLAKVEQLIASKGAFDENLIPAWSAALNVIAVGSAW